MAAVQTVSGGDVAANLAQAEPLIAEAAAKGARLVVLPEYFGIFGAHATAQSIAGEWPGAALYLLGAMAVLTATLAPWAVAAAVRIGLE